MSLSVKNVKKSYGTNNVLNNVSFTIENGKICALLGPSGSGKSTLLNLIGGIENVDSGSIIVNDKKISNLKEKELCLYRRNELGFIFQFYNLIPNLTVRENIETSSNLSKNHLDIDELLKTLNLVEHQDKFPNQLSGGQQQRCAIGRAIVKNPSLLLCDEPTGALDSETSKQIMELLKEVAKDKLVIMVTHNPELADIYSTRIIRLKDGKIVDDTNPYDDRESDEETNEVKKKKSKKTSMKFLTALSLSLNNLLTKKGRTFLTAFAGSIGIIGIALILAMSSGVNNYIEKTEKETLATYPLSISASSMDMSSIQSNRRNQENITCKNNSICTTDDITNNVILSMTSSMKKNNLIDLKKSFDNNYKNINDYVTDIKYLYNLDLQIYSSDYEDDIIQVNPNSFSVSDMIMSEYNVTNTEEQNGVSMSINSSMNNVFSELIDNTDLLKGQYDMLAGRLPEKYNELVLVVDENEQVPASLMYALDIKNRNEIKEILDKKQKGEDISLESINYSYDDLIGKNYKLLLNTDYYQKVGKVWVDQSKDEKYLKNKLNNALDLTIVGIMKVSDNASSAQSGFVGYTHDLAEYVINNINSSDIAREQMNNKDINVLTGRSFNGSTITYETVLKVLGINDLNDPSSINIYPKDYNSKEEIKKIIDEYNDEQSEENKIKYTDYVGVLMSGITTIVDVISYVLIAFVAISLIVSSIMIAIITYISVLERTKEIGILRAIGASKKDITRVFNSETIIEGFIAGVLGVMVTMLLCIPANKIVGSLTGVNNIASLEIKYAITLIIISVVLTTIAGFIPSKIASKKDPVEALRSE